MAVERSTPWPRFITLICIERRIFYIKIADKSLIAFCHWNINIGRTSKSGFGCSVNSSLLSVDQAILLIQLFSRAEFGQWRPKIALLVKVSCAPALPHKERPSPPWSPASYTTTCPSDLIAQCILVGRLVGIVPSLFWRDCLDMRMGILCSWWTWMKRWTCPVPFYLASISSLYKDSDRLSRKLMYDHLINIYAR